MLSLVFVSLLLKHVFIVFHNNNKKKMGEKMQNFVIYLFFIFFPFDGFSDITCVFA
jgi:hypothetical protein